MIRLTILSATLALVLGGAAMADDLVGAADRAFVATVNQQCLFAAKLAGAASNKGTTPDIRQAASAAAAHGGQLCATLKRLADKWQIGTPGTLERPFSEEYDRIVGLSGLPFDEAYRSAMTKVATTEAAAAADEEKSGLNPDLRAFAAGPLRQALQAETAAAPAKP